MASTQQTMVFMTYVITVYVGYFNAVIGLIGNLINIFMFTQLKVFRRNQSTFYLIIASIVDSCQLIITNMTRITTMNVGIDPTRIFLIWCKTQAYLTQLTQITSMITICFASIDQYLSTKSCMPLRQISSFRLAQCFMVILLIFSVVYSISFLIFYEIRGIYGCATFNSVSNYFYSFVYYCIFVGILPIVVSSLFSLLTYRNVRHAVNRQMPIVRPRLDHHLTAMILLRVALFGITTSPYTIFRIYQINNPTSHNYSCFLTVDEFINEIFLTVYNFNYSSIFYIFLISSNQFRRQVKYICYNNVRCKFPPMRMNRNRVAPEHELQIVEYFRSGIPNSS